MIKILFLIHDLGQGGAEKVLVNLVNNMDCSKFDITVISLFGGGVNEQFLASHVHYYSIFRREIFGNSKLMKFFTPKQLHRICVRNEYDIEISYLEGPSARVISGSRNINTKLISWIHVEQHTMKALASSFRNEKEALYCYERFDQTVCVSESVKQDFCKILGFSNPCSVLYNTVESERIKMDSKEPAPEILMDGRFNLVAVGSLKESKGYLRLLRIVKKLRIGYPVRLYILGIGPQQVELEEFVRNNNMEDSVIFLGYKINPYKYVAKCNLFVCASFAEGFSTAATEALIVGTPVCTVEVSGMREMLGNNEYGLITENNEEDLYEGIKKLLEKPELLEDYRERAKKRGMFFSTEKTVKAVEEMLLSLV